MDRERGHISVGQNVPFIISNEVTDGGNAIQKIERRDVGVSLSVAPHVLASGVPVLKDVPLLGALFRSERSDKSQKELTMMIRTTLL